MQRVPIDVWELIASKVDHVCDWRNLTLTCKFLSRLAFGESRTRILRELTHAYLYPRSEETRFELVGTTIRHRCDDLPAIMHAEYSEWYQYGLVHRDGDKPAYEHHDGYKAWLQHGKCHRDNDMPAIIYHKHAQWYKHGKFIKEVDYGCPGCLWCLGF